MIKGALVFATGLAVGTFYGLVTGSLLEKEKQKQKIHFTQNISPNPSTTESKTT